MKPYKSFLADVLEDYIAYRYSLGFTNKGLRSTLRHFDTFIKEENADWNSFTPLFFLGFREALTQGPSSVNLILSAVRGFFNYLIRRELYDVNPLADLPARRENYFIPYVFSRSQAEELLNFSQAIIRKNNKYFLHDLALHTAMVLLVRCGLRISEPLRLHSRHYRREEKTLYIEKTKFHKDRLIPVPEAVAIAINNYIELRSRFIADNQVPFLLVNSNHGPLSSNHMYPLFAQAVKELDLWEPKKTIGRTTFGAPTPHSLRHSFAVNTLKSIRERGKSPQQALPILSAYMGHRKYRYTALYLKVLEAGARRALVDFTVARRREKV